MAGTAHPSYGTPNWELIQRWLALDAAADGPFWALNLMKYRPVAEYGDEGGPAVSGKEADDAYAPLGPLAAIGATVVFHGDVTHQLAGRPEWDRIGIVRYPTRAAFFAMQRRDDFKDQHVHKEAGMDFTIVMSCLPNPCRATVRATTVRATARSCSSSSAANAAARGSLPPGTTLVADFSVEGVIVGDERSFDRARFVQARDDAALAALVEGVRGADEAHVLVVDRAVDRLVESIRTAPKVGG